MTQQMDTVEKLDDLDYVVSTELLEFKNLYAKITEFTRITSEFFSKPQIFKNCSHLTDTNSKPIEVTLTPKEINLIGQMQFVNNRHSTCYVPGGLNVSYPVYLGALEPAVLSMVDVKDRVLTPFARFLAENVNNPDALLKGNGISVKEFKSVNIDLLGKKLASCFKRGSNVSKVNLSKAFANNREIVAVTSAVGELNNRVLLVNHQDIITTMQTIGIHLNKITATLENDEHLKVSKPAIDVLYKLSITAAKELEFYAITQYQLRATSVALQDTIKGVTRGA